MKIPFQWRKHNLGLNRLDRLKNHGVAEATILALRNFVAHAQDRELYLANPRYLAERLKLSEPDALHLLAASAASGVMTLHWHVGCPSCTHPAGTVAVLSSITPTYLCHACGNHFDAYLDVVVSVRFSISETVRRLAPHHDDPIFRQQVDERLGVVPALALINIPTFRDLVTDQILLEGQSLGIQRLTIFFSDLCGSTAMYHRLGDARAYELVAAHFRAVFGAVARNNGSAVKTLGDGIMGAFSDTGSALCGVAEAIRAIQRLNDNAGLVGDDRLQLKIGMHVGPCIVVTLNRRLDFFGESVNIAARLNGLTQNDQVILSNAVLAKPAHHQQAENLGRLDAFTTTLRGLSGNFDLHRWNIRIPIDATKLSG
jgi:class 3 adenylate cyclase